MALARDFDAFTAQAVEADDADDRPIFLVNLDDVRHKVQVWRERLPRVTPFYAMKCNDLQEIVRLLADMDIGFDCASIVS